MLNRAKGLCDDRAVVRRAPRPRLKLVPINRVMDVVVRTAFGPQIGNRDHHGLPKVKQALSERPWLWDVLENLEASAYVSMSERRRQ